jgi:hypothetical protein
MAGGMQPITERGYALLYLPDVNNFQLQSEGQAPVFYWVPNQIRMARKDGPDQGDYLFNLIRFAGTQSAETTVGATEDREVAGGLLTFTVTGSPPAEVLRASQQQILDQYSQSTDFFWGIRASRPPIFRPAIITENITSISSVSPTPRGLPTMRVTRSGDRQVLEPRGAPARQLPAVVRGSEAAADSNLDPWYWHMQGQGSGSIDPAGTQAFSALIGAYPAAILWESFHGTASPVVVIQAMKLKVWSPMIELRIRGQWKRVFDHFSAAASGRYLWASVDIKAELNRMRINGDIEVEVKVDSTIPGGEEIARKLDERSDLVFQRFMEAAKQIIFEPPQPQVEAAQASSSSGRSLFSPWGAGLSLKYRRDETDLRLEYHETRQEAYLQEHTPSSSLAGMYEEMHRDPEAERKYFRSVYLDDWPRKLARLCRPVAAWGDGTVESLSVQVGYPNTDGSLQWQGHLFGPPGPEGGDDSWKFRATQKVQSDVTNPPQGWQPDITFIKRKVHLAEPPSEIENPYVRVQIDQNVIDLDPEPNGTPLNDTILEVRADSAGRLAVGPIELGAVLTDATQLVEVLMEATDDQGSPVGRQQVRFRWKFDDADRDRLWMVFTGDPEFRAFFRYRVQVTIKGTLFEPGKSWEGPWVQASGNGPITISVPRPNDPGVTTRMLPAFMTGLGDGEMRTLAAAPRAVMAPAGTDAEEAPAEELVGGYRKTRSKAGAGRG